MLEHVHTVNDRAEEREQDKMPIPGGQGATTCNDFGKEVLPHKRENALTA